MFTSLHASSSPVHFIVFRNRPNRWKPTLSSISCRIWIWSCHFLFLYLSLLRLYTAMKCTSTEIWRCSWQKVGAWSGRWSLRQCYQWALESPSVRMTSNEDLQFAVSRQSLLPGANWWNLMSIIDFTATKRLLRTFSTETTTAGRGDTILEVGLIWGSNVFQNMWDRQQSLFEGSAERNDRSEGW